MFGIKISVSHDYKHLVDHVSAKNNLINRIDRKIKSNIILSNFASSNFQSKIYLFNSHCCTFMGAYIRPLEMLLPKNTTELVLSFHKNITKLVFICPNMGQKRFKVLTKTKY